MGWGLLGSIFGTKKAVDNILDKDNGLLKGVGGWIDDFNYTDEERSVAQAEVRTWGLKQLDALAPFKVVQRILAFAATTLWVICGLNVLVAIWVEALTDLKVVTPILEFALSSYIVYPVIACYSLYFSGGVVDSFKRKDT